MAGQPLQVLLGGSDRSATMQPDWRLDQTWGQRGSEFTCRLMDSRPTGGGPNFVVQPLQTFSVRDTTLNVTLFSGLVVNSELISLQQGRNEWHVVAKDWSYLLDRAVVKGDYVTSTADYIINDLLTQIPGYISRAGGVGTAVTSGAITSNNVQQGPMLQRVLINWMSMTEAINRIGRKLAGGYFGWFVDENRDLHWFNQTQVAPVTPYFSDDSADISPNVARYNAVNFGYHLNASDIRNRVYVRGGRTQISNTRTDNFQVQNGGGPFPLYFPVHTAAPGFALTVGGVSKTCSIDNGSANPSTQWIVSKGIPGNSATLGLWWLRPGTDPMPANGTNISLTYTFVSPVIAQVDDGASQASFNTLPNLGIFSSAVNDNAVVDAITAQARGRRDLKEYSQPLEEVSFVTEPGNFTQHVKAGDVINFRSKVVPDSKNGYASGALNAYYLITRSVVEAVKEGPYRRYSITARRVT